ncbi:MAG: membrane dipeptidase [Clostridia bacterium]|nr:membrane dipeptidase [Clostridia bacterium]
MKYIDLHCDTLTASKDKNLPLDRGNFQAGIDKLEQSGCAAQCFAIFTDGENASKDFEKYLSFYSGEMQRLGTRVTPINRFSDLKRCLDGGGLGVILTVENLGFIGDDVTRLDSLYKSGVRMASPVWNFENALAYPNLKFKDGLPQFSAREERGLKNLGRQAVERLDELGIIVDLSHLSDGGAEEILSGRKTPVVASHSNAASVCPVCRNLTDGLIKKTAACGGVIGVNFCVDFLGGGGTAESVLKHIRRIINVGGEDVIAFGSDFDGIPQNPYLKDCTAMPGLLNFLNMHGLSSATLEKLAYKNFSRVFKEVCG